MKSILTTLFRVAPMGALISILAGIASGAGAAAMAIIISRALEAQDRDFTLALMFFGAAAIHFVLRVFSENKLIALTQEVLLEIRLSLGHRLLATPQPKLQSIGKQPLLTILTRDMDSFANAVQLIPLLIGNLLLIVGCFAYMAWINWQVSLVILACLFIGATVFKIAERRPMLRIIKLREEIDQLYIRQRSLIEGSRELQLNRPRGAYFVDRVIGPAAREVATDYVSAMSSYIWVLNIGNSLFYLVIGVVLFALPGLTGFDLLPVVLLMLYLIKPVSEVMISLPALRQSMVAFTRIEQLETQLDAQTIVADPITNVQTIQMRGVCHNYHTDEADSQFTLGPLDLTVNSGEILFIIGGNGSGKTTLAMMLCGLFAPESGTIEIDGITIDDTNRDSYRQAFSVVFSDFHLFEQLPGVNTPEMEDRANHYIRALRMENKVSVVDGCLSTTDLSAGQRKRLTLVSAWLEDRPIYLFDEWAADQDPVFKSVFYNELLPELRAAGKSVVVISHDDAYFDAADRIVKLTDGQLQEVTK